MKVIIENSTGDVIAASFSDLTTDGKYDSNIHSIRTDAPEGVKVKLRRVELSKEWHRWDGAKYVIVSNSVKFDKASFDKQRSKLFRDTEWRYNRFLQQELYLVDPSIKAEFDSWIAYWQSLRDMTEQQGFDPNNPQWPAQP